MAPMIDTPRLRLVPLSADHFEPMAAMYADPEVMRFLEAAPLDREESWRRLAFHVGHWVIRGYGNFACLEKTSGTFVGRCGPWFPEGWPALEIGYTLRRESWGHGYATEAAIACARYAYETLKAPTVVSLVHPDNVRSQRVAERGGAKLEKEIHLRGHPARLFVWPER
jgi:RimJ/RimL family protein N-acetyltransferase